jgi:hypothetical protein
MHPLCTHYPLTVHSLDESLAPLLGVLAAQPQRHPLHRGQAAAAADVVALWRVLLALPTSGGLGPFVAPGDAALAGWICVPHISASGAFLY